MERRKPHHNLSLPEIKTMIWSAWGQINERTFQAGDLLLELKGKMAHGDWKSFIDRELPFKYHTARRLCRIAECKFLRKVAHAQLLPRSYTTLAALTTLTEDQFECAIEEGRIHPGLERFQVVELKRSLHDDEDDDDEVVGPKRPQKARFDPIASKHELAKARSTYFERVRELSDEDMRKEIARFQDMCRHYMDHPDADMDGEDSDDDDE